MATRRNENREKRTGNKKNRTLVVEGGEIGIITGGEFQSYTNFSMEVVCAVKSPDDVSLPMFGFVYRIRRSTDGERM